MIAFLSLVFAISVFSQDFMFKMTGSFPSSAGAGADSPATVNYTISWNETSTEIQGVYQDNFFAQNPRMLTGSVLTEGRRFSLILPTPVQGVRQIVVTTPARGFTSGSVSTTVRTEDNLGRVVDSENPVSLITQLPSANNGGPDNGSCIVGFGALSGYCGLYNGNFNEILDNNNRCDLPTARMRLELASDTVFRLFINYVPGAATNSTHNLGAFLPSPSDNTINVTRQECEPQPGTSFEIDNCRTLDLNGTFFARPDDVNFSGTYTISDNVNGDKCIYSMNLIRETRY